MNDYILTCCSTADESRSFFEERNIEVIFFRWISDDGSVHIDDLGQSMPYGTFYDLMRKGMLPKTSQPNIQDFTDFFEPLLKDGKDVIHVSLGSAISAAFILSYFPREIKFFKKVFGFFLYFSLEYDIILY